MHPDPVPASDGARSVRPDQAPASWHGSLPRMHLPQVAPAEPEPCGSECNVLPPHDPGSSGHTGVSKGTGQRQSMTGVKGQ